MSQSSSLCLPGTSTPPASHTGGAVVYSHRAGGTTPLRASLLGAVSALSAARGCFALGGFAAGLQTRGDCLGLRATTTRPPATALVGIVSWLDATVGAVGRLLALVLVGAHGRGEARLRNGVRDRLGDQLHGANRIVVAGDGHGDEIGIGIGVDDADDRDAELVRLVDGDPLFLRIDDEEQSRQPRHVLDAGEVLLELQALARQEQLLLLGVVLELTALLRALLQLLHAADLL